MAFLEPPTQNMLRNMTFPDKGFFLRPQLRSSADTNPHVSAEAGSFQQMRIWFLDFGEVAKCHWVQDPDSPGVLTPQSPMHRFGGESVGTGIRE